MSGSAAPMEGAMDGSRLGGGQRLFKHRGHSRRRVPHGLLAKIQVVEHRGVGARKLPAPVPARFKESTASPAGQRSLAYSQLIAGYPCAGPGGRSLAVHGGKSIEAHVGRRRAAPVGCRGGYARRYSLSGQGRTTGFCAHFAHMSAARPTKRAPGNPREPLL